MLVRSIVSSEKRGSSGGRHLLSTAVKRLLGGSRVNFGLLGILSKNKKKRLKMFFFDSFPFFREEMKDTKNVKVENFRGFLPCKNRFGYWWDELYFLLHIFYFLMRIFLWHYFSILAHREM